MAEPIAYAIDFGTSNSSIGVAFDDRVEVLQLEPSSPMPAAIPSIAYLHKNQNRAAGRRAVEQFLVTGAHRTACSTCPLVHRQAGELDSDCRHFRIGGGCHDSRLLAGLKNELSNVEFLGTHSWALDFDLPDLVAVVLADLKRAADRRYGTDVRRVVIGYPVVFVGAEGSDFEARQELALSRLRDAAEAAGFEEVEPYPEPAAAVVNAPLEPGVSVAVDFGGGTFDVAVFEAADEVADIMSLRGAAIGGERFDAALFHAKLSDDLGLNARYRNASGVDLPVPAWFRLRMATLSGVKMLLHDPQTWALFNDFGSYRSTHSLKMCEEILFGGQAFQFHRAIEDAKIALSAETETTIEFHRPGIDISVSVSQQEFNDLIASDLDTVMHQVDLALDESGVSASDVRSVIRTGGSSQLPAFYDRLASRFSVDRIRDLPPFSSVVKGLAMVAIDTWSNA